MFTENSSSTPRKDTRVRNWTAVLYPDSLPSNWISILDEFCVPWCCSPLHDKDIDGDNKPKKAHYHIALKFTGKKSFEQVCKMLEPLHCPIPQPITDLQGTVRYFAHIDSPHKYQYSPSDIKGHNGFDVATLLRPTTGARYELIGDMVDFIAEHHITEFMDFLVYCKAKRFDTWYPLLCDNSAIVIKEAIKSNRHRGGMHYIDFDTGEILIEDDRILPPTANNNN